MPVTTYECLVMFDANKMSGNIDTARDALIQILEKNGCEIISHRVWDDRRFAYPIGHQRKGVYYMVYFQTETKNIQPIEADFRINELILRHLTLAIHPKWVEPLLEVARDERATCLKLMGDDLEETATRHVPRTGPAAVALAPEPERQAESEPGAATQSVEESSPTG